MQESMAVRFSPHSSVNLFQPHFWLEENRVALHVLFVCSQTMWQPASPDSTSVFPVNNNNREDFHIRIARPFGLETSTT